LGYADEALPGPIGHRKLTDAQVQYIREQSDWDGITRRQLAHESGVSPSTISDIATGRTWRWLRRPGEPAMSPPSSRSSQPPPPRPRHGR
jgi:Helix-turn-helix